MEATFGAQLKDWQGRRRYSQLDLALVANVSARHIAFLETGRSKPSRQMVVQLSNALTVPRAERNALLSAAGFAASYRQRGLDDQDMAHVRSAVTWTLERHVPYPAFAVDRHWHLVMANAPAQRLLAGTGIGVGDSMLDAILSSQTLRDAIVNWPDVVRHMHLRLRTESVHLGGDKILDAAAKKLADQMAPQPDDGELPAVVPTLYRAGNLTLSFMSTIAQFGTAEDIALADLKIELMFPADEPTRALLTAQSEADSGASNPGG